MPTQLPPELAAVLDGDDLREKYASFVDLVRLLGDSIIANDYSIPDGLSSSVKLTDYGDAALTKVVTAKADKIPAKEARLMCALAIGREKLLVDIEATDLDGMSKAVSAQILSGKIRFPFAFGRESYDAYAAMFEEGQPVLTYDETQRFLDSTPTGVQQYGRYVTGPYGLLESQSTRQLASGRRVEAFHCSDTMCDAAHRIHLTTSSTATINSHRDRFEDAFPDNEKKEIDWFGAADDVRDVDAIMFSDTAVGVSATLLGDALSLRELRALIAYLLNATAGSLRKLVSPFLEVNDANAAVADLDRAQLMQIALLVKETVLQEALDSLVFDGEIHVPRGEVRCPVLNKERRSGAFGLSPELGSLGVRFVSDHPGFAALRLRDELTNVYALSEDSVRSDLEWMLRGIVADSLEEQLDTFFRTAEPLECVTRLGLVSRDTLSRLAKNLRIAHGLDEGDVSIANRILWKLGFPLHSEQDPRAEYWRLHEKLLGLTRASSAPGTRDTEEFLGVASKYFRELERFLQESLAFSAWALLHDHVVDPHAYQYGFEADNARGLELVQESVSYGGDSLKSYDFLSDKLDIYTMARGFEFLSARLSALATESESLGRPRNDFPAYSRGSRLKKFPFTSTAPFLSLTEGSRLKITSGLKSVAQALQRGKVNEVRNDHQHYRKTASGVGQIEQALREAENAMRMIESLGLALVESQVEDAVHDRWGRSEYYLAAPRGTRHVIARPSSYDWLGLPELDQAQYILRGAVFAEPNEVLRFQRRLDSEYSEMWQNIPARRRPRGSALSQNSVEHRGTEVRGA
ncbi:hypothetical protein [Microbacterium oxydans]|uniref:hypothetical protein n=1 Tax=Microbacterium oxydans TaxID=82380 RepID=UPI00111D178E|nr:hypothetical protein [Microbacterium oxydans]